MDFKEPLDGLYACAASTPGTLQDSLTGSPLDITLPSRVHTEKLLVDSPLEGRWSRLYRAGVPGLGTSMAGEGFEGTAPDLSDTFIRVVIADDQRLFANGLARIIGVQTDMEVVGEAHTGEEAISLCLKEAPDIVLMDLSMPGMGGVSATRKILSLLPRTRVLILTVHTDDVHVFQGIKAGAQGYILKDCTPEELTRAIHTVHAGETIMSQDIAKEMLTTFESIRSNTDSGLHDA